MPFRSPTFWLMAATQAATVLAAVPSSKWWHWAALGAVAVLTHTTWTAHVAGKKAQAKKHK